MSTLNTLDRVNLRNSMVDFNLAERLYALLNVTAGTVTAGSAVVADSNKDVTGLRNVTATGTVTGATVATTDLTVGNDITIAEAGNIILGASTGTKIGTSATAQKLGFFNATPIVQPTAAGQASSGTMTTVGSNTGTSGAGLSLIGDTTSVDQAANIMNDLKALQEDIAALSTLQLAMRTALVNLGIMKGS